MTLVVLLVEEEGEEDMAVGRMMAIMVMKRPMVIIHSSHTSLSGRLGNPLMEWLDLRGSYPL